MILVCFGTRPEYIKISPVIKELQKNNIDYKILFTGQHQDLTKEFLKDNFISLQIESGQNRLDSIVSSVLNKGHVFANISAVLVQGDTTSAFAVALAAFHRKIKIIHLEAGLRTNDLSHPYPEELNRQMISRMADINLCPTELNRANLLKECVVGQIHVVGNTVLDNLVDIKTDYKQKVVVTLHRRENHEKMDEWFREIDKLAKDNKELEFIIPLHPNPNVQKHKHILKNLKIINPLRYDEFISLLAESKFVITDSGGLQEETSFLGKKCIVCREKTERTESVGKFSFMCESPKKLKNIFNIINKDHIPSASTCPYGDGTASKKIISILKNEI